MSVRVEVNEGEPIQDALRRLRTKVRYAYRRQWYKTRPGAYDKPGNRRRRKRGLDVRNTRTGHRNTVYLGLTGLHVRTEPFFKPRKAKKRRRYTPVEPVEADMC